MGRELEIERLTKTLVKQESISNPEDALARKKEVAMGRLIKNWFDEHGVSCFLQELSDGRNNVYAFVKGKSPNTIVLAGHFDTVGIDPYEKAGINPSSMAFDADTLAEEQEIDIQKFVVGRGAFDMKSGIAVAMTLMDEWNRKKDGLEGSILFVATCDEENDSWGILNAPDVLLRANGLIDNSDELGRNVKSFTGGDNLNLLGVVNLDYTTERYPGDPEHHVWRGTIGKLLPSISVVGQETHAGEHFGGFHASTLIARIVNKIEGNMEFADETVPPTTLKLTDDKTSYNVMTATKARAYFNLFSVGKTPAEIIAKIHQSVGAVVDEYIGEIGRNYKEYCQRLKIPEQPINWKEKTLVMRYSDLHLQAVKKLGEKKVGQIVDSALAKAQNKDKRDKSYAIVEELLSAIGFDGPTIVVFYSPPFYPYIKPDPGKLSQVTQAAISETEEKFGVAITMHDFYPYISDMSYLRLEPEIAETIAGLTGEMPLWNLGYSLDLEKIKLLNLPVVDVGPYGFGAHRTDERAEKRYSFKILPDLIKTIVRNMFTK